MWESTPVSSLSAPPVCFNHSASGVLLRACCIAQCIPGVNVRIVRTLCSYSCLVPPLIAWLRVRCLRRIKRVAGIGLIGPSPSNKNNVKQGLPRSRKDISFPSSSSDLQLACSHRDGRNFECALFFLHNMRVSERVTD